MLNRSERAMQRMLCTILLVGCNAGTSLDGSAPLDAAAPTDGSPSPHEGGLLVDAGRRDATPTASSDAGPITPGTWRNITPAAAPPTAPCTDLQFDPSNPSTLYAFMGGDHIYRSTDAGAHWMATGDMPTPLSLGRVRIDPGNPMHLYATGSVNGSSLGFWVSHDGGTSWQIPDTFRAGAVAARWTMDVYNIAVDPTDFDHFILTFHGGWSCCGEDAGVVESTDGGVTFVAHAPAMGMNHGQGIAFLYDIANGQGDSRTWLVGGGYAAGIFRTSDGGAHWAQVSDAQDNHGGFDAHYSSQGYLYIGVEGGILRSIDNGMSWERETDGVPYNWYYGVISDGHFLYTSASFVGVAQSQAFVVSPEGGADEGRHWTAFDAPILEHGPWRMVFEPTGHTIYDASWSGGCWALDTRP